MNGKKNPARGPAIFGLILIVFGVLWILNNTEVIRFQFHEWWPLIIIAIGLGHLINRQRFFDLGGWLFIIVGTAFFLTENHFVNRHELWKYWPVLLVIAGIVLIFNRSQWPLMSNKSYCTADTGSDETKDEGGSSTAAEQINESAIFAGLERRITSKHFKGGTLSAIFGGMDINLVNAELSEGSAVLDATAIFGGITIIIPTSWVIEIHTTAIFAGVEQNCTNLQQNTGKRLIVNANAIFAGIEIKN